MKPIALDMIQAILKSLARATLKRYKPRIMGITGNIGKTSTKEAIKSVLSVDRKVRAPSKNFNNELGLPLTILGKWQETGDLFFWIKVIISSALNLIFKKKSYPEIIILEYGVDRPGDMKKLLEIARPHIGVMTAIGDVPVHIEFFQNKESLTREKLRLISQLPATGFAILNADDDSLNNVKNGTRAHVITFGFSDKADVRISNFEAKTNQSKGEITFKLNYSGSVVPVKIENVLGKAQAVAAAAAAAAGLSFGMNLVKVSEALSKHLSPPGRMRVIPGLKKSIIIDDTYNSAPLSAKEALETLINLKAKRKIAVLGDMLELGKYTIDAHYEIGKLVSQSVKILITVGDKAKFIAEAAEKNGLPKKSIFVFNNLTKAGQTLQEIIKQGDLILIKGSQGVRLEKIVFEVMAQPDRAEKVLVRQNKRWLTKKGMYEQ